VAPEPEGSSPHSQQPANGPYPEPGESTPHPPQPIYLRSILIPSSHLRLGLPSGLFPSGFHTKTVHTFLPSPMRATYPTHLILLDLICLIISGDEYKFWSPPHCASHTITKYYHHPKNRTVSRVAQSVQCLTTDWTAGVRSPTEAEDFSSNLCVQTGSGTHPASCTMGTGGSFPGGKGRPGRDADHSPPSSAEVKKE
jgi:hypothetical protein